MPYFEIRFLLVYKTKMPRNFRAKIGNRDYRSANLKHQIAPASVVTNK